MKYKLAKPFLFLAVFILIVGLACNAAAPEAPAKVEQPSEPEQTVPMPTQPILSTGAVSTLQDVQNAVIQIEAEGTFVDFEGAYAGAGKGSGFIIDPSGLAVTNNHVVTGAALLKVWVGGNTGKTYNARVVAVSECSDLAVIDIEGDGFSYLEWYTDPINVGLDVYSVGFPLGAPEYTLTKGIVSKENTGGETDWASVDAVIMHDATINPGNSGGPLVTADGKVIGVNYASYSDANQYFAIGREKALPIIEELRSGKDIASIGINGQAVTSDDGTVSGIWVASVAPGSPAERAGVWGGDIIMELQGHSVGVQGVMSDYCDIIRTHSATDTMAVGVYRLGTDEFLDGQINGKVLEVTVPNYTGATGSTGDSSSDSEPIAGGFIAITDNTGSLYIEVPSSWNDIDGTIWESTWGTASNKQDFVFQAANIIAAPSLADFNDYWSAPGVNFAASSDWGKIGGYVELLDDAGEAWYKDSCTKLGRYTYEDPVYEGRFDVWDCGVDADVVVLSARPINDRTAYLTLVQIQIGEDVGDTEGLVEERIADTFDIQGSLP